jgi:hypothetical protein
MYFYAYLIVLKLLGLSVIGKHSTETFYLRNSCNTNSFMKNPSFKSSNVYIRIVEEIPNLDSLE